MVFWKQPVEEKISESLPPVSRHDVLCIPVSKTKVTGKVLGCHLSFGAILIWTLELFYFLIYSDVFLR